MSAHTYDDGFKSCDLMTLSGVLRVSDLEMVLLGANSPRVIFGSRVFNDLLFLSAEPDFAFRGRFALPLDWCLIGYIHDTNEGSWCHGTPLSAGMAFTVMPEGVSEFMLSAGSRISCMLVPLERLRASLGLLSSGNSDLAGALPGLFQFGASGQGAALGERFEDLRGKLLLDRSADALAQLDGDFADVLLGAHLQAAIGAGSNERPQCSRGRRTHYLILQRTEHFMRANLRRDIYINEMCNAAGVSERALRYAFEDLLGTSPNRYLSLLRLCTACRSLSLADASRRSVKSVALSCGLWDLSRFADNYRRVFGELPRDTLMRTPPRESGGSHS